MLQDYPALFYPLLFVFGLCIGSFLNVVIVRLPALVERELALDKQTPLPNLIRPGSHCPNCKSSIRWFDNIPLVSYLLLKGNCRNCGCKISSRYFWVELLCGLLFVFCAVRFGSSTQLLWALVLTSFLIVLTFIDLDTWLLPDSITLPGIGLGIICNFFNIFVSLQNALIGAIVGYLILWSIYQIHHRITGREGMGYGDFKLLAMLGAWLGWQSLPIIMLISSLAGLFIFIVLKILINFDYTKPIPFGPFLAIAGWIYLINQSNLLQIITG